LYTPLLYAVDKEIIYDNYLVKFESCALLCSHKVYDGDEPSLMGDPKISRFHERSNPVLPQLTNEKSIAITGFSHMSCNLAYNLASKNVDVILLAPADRLLKNILPPYLSEQILEELSKAGVSVKFNKVVEFIEPIKSKIRIECEDGEVVRVDKAILTSLSYENYVMAPELEIDPNNGGYSVNNEFYAQQGIYVTGDAASYYDYHLGRRRSDFTSHALISATFAATNMSANERIQYLYQPSVKGRIGEIKFEAIGITELRPDIQTYGIFEEKDPTKGIVYYLRKGQVIGILFWNISGKIPEAVTLLNKSQIFEFSDEILRQIQL